MFNYLPDHHFGLTVIDECSQGVEPACYPGVLRSPKLIIAGDHKQLPPTVNSPYACYLKRSLMERVVDTYGDKVVKVLTSQYRMNKLIMQWSSDTMYDGLLFAHQSVENHLLTDLPGVDNNEYTSK